MNKIDLARRMAGLAEISEAESTAVADLEVRQRSWRRGATLQRENESSDEVFVLKDGWVGASTLLNDGSRQIIQIHLPGEMMGSATLLLGRAAQTLSAITEVTAAVFDRAAFARLLSRHPRLANLFMAMVELERVSLADRLSSLGRGSGRARIAAFLLDLLRRLRQLDPTMGDTMPLRLTQEQIGDATGLTAVHVNRMMRALVEEGLVERDGTSVRIVDEAALMRLAQYVDRGRPDLNWLMASA